MKARFSGLTPLAFAALLLLPTSAFASAADLANAKALYASASYEEALAALSALDPATDGAQVDQYKALCFLALGQTGDAEDAIQQLVLRHPRYTPSGDEVPPRLIEMFSGVRRRTLPTVAQTMYAKAKGSYDHHEFEAARNQFRELLDVIAAAEPDEQGSSFADLKTLAEGFLTLTGAEMEKAAAASRPAPNPAPPPAPVVPQRQVYSAADRDVTAPVEVTRRMPPWFPPTDQLRRTVLRGTLTLAIDERGRVESASLGEPMWPQYDEQLIASAKTWQFRPASKDGRPVKYIREFEIVLQPEK